MKKIEIEPGCITCGACEFIAPEVFEIDEYSQVKKNIDFDQYEEKIKLAAQMCPVQVIKIKE